MASGVTLARDVDNHAFCHASRDFDFHDLFAFLDARAAAVLTLVLNDSAFAAAGRTDALRLHHAEDALCSMGDDT